VFRISRFVAVAAATLLWLVGSAPATAAVYQPPVDGSVVDGFRPPANPYGPGNRGWEYDVQRSAVVRAPADGVVTFAGQVGGTRTIVIQHDDGVRTTLSKLARVDVRKGEPVAAGQAIGEATNQVYFGARCGDVYIDPPTLLGRRVRLVPLDGGTGGQRPTSPACSEHGNTLATRSKSPPEAPIDAELAVAAAGVGATLAAGAVAAMRRPRRSGT
jgi:murein DD-endopeptidase MepM/ murein hydrolase activator NlpD